MVKTKVSFNDDRDKRRATKSASSFENLNDIKGNYLIPNKKMHYMRFKHYFKK